MVGGRILKRAQELGSCAQYSYALCNRTHGWFCSSWKELWKSITKILLPRGCAGCNKPDEILCDTCKNSLSNIYSKDFPGSEYGKLYACGLYENNVRKAILLWKDHNDVECDAPFSNLISSLALNVISNSGLKIANTRSSTRLNTITRLNTSTRLNTITRSNTITHLNTITRSRRSTRSNTITRSRRSSNKHSAEILIIPMPSSKKSSRKRGRKHVLPLAKAIASNLKNNKINARVCCAIQMRKNVSNKSVQTYGIKGRAERTTHAFNVTKSLVKGKKVIIVDDIVTSGSTMTNCAISLRKSGAEVLTGFALAITPQKIA